MPKKSRRGPLGSAIWVIDTYGRLYTVACLGALAVSVGIVIAVVMRAVSHLPAVPWLILLAVACALLVLVLGSLGVAVALGGDLTVSRRMDTCWITRAEPSGYALIGSVFVSNASDRELFPTRVHLRRIKPTGSRLSVAMPQEGYLEPIASAPPDVIKPGRTGNYGLHFRVGPEVDLSRGAIAKVTFLDQFEHPHRGVIDFQAALAPPPSPETSQQPELPIGPSDKLQITTAEYGANNSWADVTGIVSGNVRGGRLTMVVSNTNLGGDPLPGVVKTLKITYWDGGTTRTTAVGEGQTVELP